MCGITGIYAISENGEQSFSLITDSVNTLKLRGPNNSGTYFHKRVALGQTRLSIIDTSAAGNQPLSDTTGRYQIIFNGEFYNFNEHRNQLIEDGICFSSHTDTEVLLYLYIKHGIDFLEKINGFFALAIYDSQEESLFIARDRMGIKPLHFYKDDDKFIFASELKAILTFKTPKVINQQALVNFFQLNYIPGPISIFENYSKLEPGCYIKIKNGKIVHNRYYEIPQSINESISYSDAQSEIIRLVDASVKQRLIADVPIGCFLSGGIDSSIISTIAAKYTKQLNTFSIGYKDEPFFDETSYAQLVANKIQSNHTAFILTNDDLFSELDNILNYIDEPFADSSAIAVYLLTKRTKQHITVALSGDGADELFSGYNKHKAHFQANKKSLANSILQNSSGLLHCFPTSRNAKIPNLVRQLSRYADGLKLSPQDQYWRWCSISSFAEVQEMLVQCETTNHDSIKHLYTKNITTEFNSILKADMQLVLPYDMLTKVDLMSMANSLEVRTPFLDHNLVNFVSTLPSSYKIGKGIKKKILQDSFRDVLPAELYNRPKHGFEVPLLKWMQNALSNLINNELLNDDFIISQNIFNPEYIKKLKTQLFSDNPGDITAKIWGLIVFQKWYKQYYL